MYLVYFIPNLQGTENGLGRSKMSARIRTSDLKEIQESSHFESLVDITCRVLVVYTCIGRLLLSLHREVFWWKTEQS